MATPSSSFIKGWTFEYDSTPTAAATLANISEVTEVSGLGQTYAQVDVTNFDSTSKEYIAGLADGAEISITCNYLTNDTSQDNLTSGTDHAPGSTFDLQFTADDGTSTIVYDFAVVNLGYEVAPAIDDKNSITFNFKITGDITIT